MGAKMSEERRELILKKLAVFDRLARKNTDRTGWIALQFGVSRPAAERLILAAGEKP